jgi:hypothetical protein
MDNKKDYECVDCKTKRYLIFPNSNETLIICSACYRIRNEIKDLCKCKCKCDICDKHNNYLKKI